MQALKAAGSNLQECGKGKWMINIPSFRTIIIVPQSKARHPQGDKWMFTTILDLTNTPYSHTKMHFDDFLSKKKKEWERTYVCSLMLLSDQAWQVMFDLVHVLLPL